MLPFGNSAGQHGILDEDGLFTGKELDTDTGLYYFNARWYSPNTGRFITEDPARDGLNWMVYCSQNPLIYVDPSGLMQIESHDQHNRTGMFEYDHQRQRTYFVPETNSIRSEYREPFIGNMGFEQEFGIRSSYQNVSSLVTGGRTEGSISLDNLDFFVSGELYSSDTLFSNEVGAQSAGLLSSNSLSTWGAEGTLGLKRLLPQAFAEAYIMKADTTFFLEFGNDAEVRITGSLLIGASFGFQSSSVGFDLGAGVVSFGVEWGQELNNEE